MQLRYRVVDWADILKVDALAAKVEAERGKEARPRSTTPPDEFCPVEYTPPDGYEFAGWLKGITEIIIIIRKREKDSDASEPHQS